MRVIILTILFLITNFINGYCQDMLNGPESVEYDLENNRYFVSNYYDGAIIEMDNDGNQSLFYMGLPHSRGITIYQNTLFVVHDSGVTAIDLSTADTVYNFSAPEFVFANDIAFDSSGNFYVTDYTPASEGGGVYKINYSSGTHSKFTGDIDNLNGITYDYANNRLLACGGYPTYRIFEINPVSGVIDNEVITPFYSHDGIVLDLAGNIYISSWHTESVYRYDSDFLEAPIIVASGLSGPADIFYNQWKHEMIIPNLENNTLDTILIKTDQFSAVAEGDIVNDMGSSWSAVWIDYDNDSFQDIFVSNLNVDNLLYHNNGDGTFSKIMGTAVTTNIAGIGTSGSSWADFNNDGYPDAFHANFREGNPSVNRAFKNNGDGTFEENSGISIAQEGSNSIDPSWIDYDCDGFLDLYVANHNSANFLYHQTDSGFDKVIASPVGTDYAESNSACWSDYDNDGDPDLISLNGWGDNLNHFYVNNGDATFSRIHTGDIATATDVSWGGSWGDYDNDLDMDLFVTNSIWDSPSTSFDNLYENNGDGTFTAVFGVVPVTTGAHSFSSSWGDYDNDGDLDLVVTTSGNNLLYENLGDGSFELINENIAYLDEKNSDGAAWADYDHDGDLDLFVANSGANSFYVNNGNLNNWINIKCIGTNSNRSAIGAKVFTRAEINGETSWQMREISSRTGKNSQNSLDVHFGLGDAAIIDSIRIEWPNRVIDIYTDVTPNQFITYTESICGDADSNTNVNILDITFLISYLYKGGIAPANLTTADPDGNELINILDITYLISFLYKDGPKPVC